ncbi:MAG: P22 phage major capsid protein family protein [Burkholderia sp.]
MAANQLLTINKITREAVHRFVNSNALLGLVDKQYDNQFAQTGAKIGDSVRIRYPNDYVVGDGATIVPQATNESSTTLTLSNQKNVPVSFTQLDLTLKLDDFSERILKSAMNNLAGAVATTVMSVAEMACAAVANFDTSGNVIQPTAGTFLLAGAKLTNNSCPHGDRYAVLDPITQANAVGSLAGLFNPQIKISEQYRTGMLSKDTLGFDFYEDQTIIKHTTGTATGATVNGANQTGNTLVIAALTGNFNVGDIITVAGVFALNRVTKQTTGELQQFVITAPAAAGATSLSIYPAITPGNVQYGTVTNSPANSAPIVPYLPAGQTFRKNLCFHKQAMTVATADILLPKTGVVESAHSSYKGFSIAYVKGFDIVNYQEISRMDCVFGQTMVRPEWCCAVYSPL